MGFEWLPGVLALLRGVEPYEVMQALRAAHRWPRPAAGPDDVLLLTIWARTKAGRPLIVVTRPTDTFDFWIVAAREMYPGEAAEFKRWEATR